MCCGTACGSLDYGWQLYLGLAYNWQIWYFIKNAYSDRKEKWQDTTGIKWDIYI